MAEPNSKTLTKIFSEVLANLAFLFEDGTAAASGGDTPAIRWYTRISYFGRCAGALCLVSPPAFAELLAANLLGLEKDDPGLAGSAEDAVKEFMNILCGQFVTAVYGPQDVFNLSIPVVETETDPLPDGAVQTDELWVEGQPVRVTWCAVETAAGPSCRG